MTFKCILIKNCLIIELFTDKNNTNTHIKEADIQNATNNNKKNLTTFLPGTFDEVQQARSPVIRINRSFGGWQSSHNARCWHLGQCLERSGSLPFLDALSKTAL